MKELKDMTAAELMTERKQIEKKWGIVPDVRRIEIGSKSLQPQYDAIAAELNARCERWELSISDGGGIVFYDSEHIKIYISHDIGDSVTIRDAAEFHALIGYLLSKEAKQ